MEGKKHNSFQFSSREVSRIFLTCTLEPRNSGCFVKARLSTIEGSTIEGSTLRGSSDPDFKTIKVKRDGKEDYMGLLLLIAPLMKKAI